MVANRFEKLEEENRRLKQRVLELEREKLLNNFTTKIGNGIMMSLQITPYRRWPAVAKAALSYYGNKAPTLAVLLKERLPKE